MSRKRDDAKRNRRLAFWQQWEKDRYPLIRVEHVVVNYPPGLGKSALYPQAEQT